MPASLDYLTGDLEFGANAQITRSATIPTRPAGVHFVDSGTLSVSTTAVKFGLEDTNGRNYVICFVETDKVRFKFDTNPTATLGVELNAGDQLELENEDELANVRFIRSGSADATIQVLFGVRATE